MAQQVNKIIQRIEDAFLAFLLTAMIVAAAAQVVMRNFFDSGIYWNDSLIRVMVLWIAMIGAMVASRTDNHIRIDLLSRLINAKYQPVVRRITALFTFSVLCLFTWASFEFVRYEFIDGTIAFASVPAWLCELIMPIGGAVMALRYGLHVVKPPT